MMGSITASCGCKVDGLDDIEHVRYRDVSCDAVDGFSNAVVYASYCKKCARRLKRQKHYIATDAEEQEWLDGDD